MGGEWCFVEVCVVFLQGVLTIVDNMCEPLCVCVSIIYSIRTSKSGREGRSVGFHAGTLQPLRNRWKSCRPLLALPRVLLRQ